MRRDNERRALELRRMMVTEAEAADRERRSLHSDYYQWEREALELAHRDNQPTARDDEYEEYNGNGSRRGDRGLAEYRSRRFGGQRVEDDDDEYRESIFHYMSAPTLAEIDGTEYRTLTKGASQAGGYLVPSRMENDLLNIVRFQGTVAQLAREVVTDDGADLALPITSSHGSAAWIGESSAYSPSDEIFRQVTLKAFKATAKIIVSEELMTDSNFDLQAYLVEEFGERIGVLENTAFVVGNGTSQPEGLLSATTTSRLGSDFTLSSATVNYATVVAAIFALPPQYRANAQFICSDAMLKGFAQMTDTTGQPLTANAVSGQAASFLGYPLNADPDLPTTASGNVAAVFGDWRRAYRVRRVRGVGVQRQDELHSDTGGVGFRAFERVDGRVTLPAAAIGLKMP
jgi:HK97 family phage major capsid protein